jgi:hypothetical protein
MKFAHPEFPPKPVRRQACGHIPRQALHKPQLVAPGFMLDLRYCSLIETEVVYGRPEGELG